MSSNSPRVFLPAVVARMRELAEQGYSTKQTAQILGLSHSSLYGKSRKIGLRFSNQHHGDHLKVRPIEQQVDAACEWRAIEDAKGYMVSADGRVFSLDRIVQNSNGRSLRPGRILTLTKNSKGYLRAAMATIEGERSSRLVHRLVAKAFIPNPLGLPEVNHKDGDRWNNRVENLEWVTSKQNHRHRFEVLDGGVPRSAWAA